MDHRRIVNQVVVSAAVAVLAVAAQADTIYVDGDNCPGPGSGTEGDPYCSIQTAIDNAVDTDEIVVAEGTYLEAIDFMGKAVTLRSSDGPDVTVIDGTGDLHVVQCVSGEGPDTVLDGFTITGGAAWPNDWGGGMININSSPTVTNCIFSGNSAIIGGGMSVAAAAACATPAAVPWWPTARLATTTAAMAAAGCSTSSTAAQR